MNNNLIKKSSSIRRGASSQLHCNVVVEPSSIDFLNDGAIFVAGSSSDCSSISPLPPEPRKGHRRSPAMNKR